MLGSIKKSGTDPTLFHKNKGLSRGFVKIGLKATLGLFVEIHKS